MVDPWDMSWKLQNKLCLDSCILWPELTTLSFCDKRTNGCTSVSESLIEAIHSDIKEAEQALEKTENKEYASHSFFNKTDDCT